MKGAISFADEVIIGTEETATISIVVIFF